MIGSSISSIRIWINSFVASPLLEPIGDASGITAAAPALTRSISTDIQNAQQIATAISAEFADTARTTAVAEQTITDGKAKWDGDTDAASTARTQKEVFGGVPKVKAASGNFKYSVSADGEVTVKVGDTQLYPEAEGDWAK